MRRPVAAALALAVGLAAPPSARPQSASTFAGNYRLTLAFGPSCTTRVRSVSVFFVLSEKAVAGAAEVDGRPAIPSEVSAAELTLQRTTPGVHGPLATQGNRADREPITTVEGYIAGLWLVLDGTVSAGSGRPSARGTAVGLLEAGRPEDETPDTLGACSAADHTFTLDPV